MSNDWGRIREALWATDLKEDRKKEIWRSSVDARGCLDREGIEARAVDEGLVQRYVNEVPRVAGPTNPRQRASALRDLARAAYACEPMRRREGTLARRAEEVPVRSRLGVALSAVLAAARTEGDRRRWATCLGALLEWCETVTLEPLDLWEADVDRFRRDRLAAGYKSPGEYVRVARRLVRTLAGSWDHGAIVLRGSGAPPAPVRGAATDTICTGQ